MNRKHILIILSILLLLPWGGYGAKAKKAVFIIVDGVPADMIERLKPPAIGRIAAEGGYSRAYCGGIAGTYCETPTISAVGYNCILTSAWANKHNVWDNSPKPDYSYWSIFRIAKEQKRDVTTALYSSWTDNRTVLLGEGLPETGDLRIDYVVDGFDLDQKNYPKEKDDLQVYRIDDTVSRAAAAGIREQAPDLSWVYLWYTDDAGHIYGNGDYFDEYVMKADRQIERIWEAVEYREKYFDEEWIGCFLGGATVLSCPGHALMEEIGTRAPVGLPLYSDETNRPTEPVGSVRRGGTPVVVGIEKRAPRIFEALFRKQNQVAVICPGSGVS